MQYGQVGADGQRADEAVHENANGLAATAALPIERCRLIEVAGLHRNEHGAGDEPPKVVPVLFVPDASQQIHTNRVARREVGPEQLPDPDASGDPVSRTYSTQADVSTRIIAASAHLVEVAVPT